MKRTNPSAWSFAILLILSRAALSQATPDLAKGFAAPPESAKPQTWWHWMNGNVSKAGITADLEAMKRVGLGGAHLAQVGSNIPEGPVPYGSPQQVEMVRFAIQEATRLDMSICLFNCPGWSSSGGPWVTPENSMKVLAFTESHAIGGVGGQKITMPLPQPTATQNFYRDSVVIAYPTPAADARVGAFNNGLGRGGAGRSGPAPAGGTVPADANTVGIDPTKVLDLSKNMDAQGQLAWDAPAGNWTILRIGFTTNGTQNRPAPDGGGGLEIDKFSKEAMDFHFNTFFAPYFDDLKPLAAKGKAAALIDSYETGLQNWTDKFLDEFAKRRGYDMRPYMPAMVLGRVVGNLDRTQRFLWDVRKTQAELMDENYYIHFSELCHQHGLQSFIEPYDNGNFDEMIAGTAPDMPMGEFWQGQANQHSIKQVASISHVNGRPIMGAESFTSQSRWTEYPYALKALGDFMWTQGLNEFIFHRFAHQPNTQPDVVPGMTMGPWGGHFDRTNTWFEQSGAWLSYCSRSQFLLQRGAFVGDLAYFVGEDSPVKSPDEARLDPAPPPGHGYDIIDVVTLKNRVKIVDGKLSFPDGLTYRALVLPPTIRTMSADTMKNIHDLVEAGMTLIVNGPKIEKTPSLTGFPDADTQVAKWATDLWANLNGTTITESSFGKGKIFWGLPLADVLEKKLAAPADFQFNSRSGNADINYIHKRTLDADIYFVANRGQKSEDLLCTFNTAGKRPEFWNAQTAGISPAIVYQQADGLTRAPLHLDPSGSIFVVFRTRSATAAVESIKKEDTTLFTVTPFATPQRPAPAAPNLPRSAQNPLPLPAAEEPPAFDFLSDPAGALFWQNGSYTLSHIQNESPKPIEISGLSTKEVPGPWQLSFPPKRGAPATATFDKLSSWSTNADEGIKYFSGTATYQNHFTIDAPLPANQRLFLDLGRVQVLAEVTVNNKNLGTLWTLPFRVDITDAVKPGNNSLEIKVTNLWPNRLIGDEQKPVENQYATATGRATAGTGGGARTGSIIKIPDWYLQNQPKPDSPRITFTTWHHWSATDPLLESGLIGPVTLRTAARLNLAN